MSRTAKFKVAPNALSVLETDVLEHYEDDPEDDYEPIRRAFDRDSLIVEPGGADALADALNALSNHCDDLVEARVNRLDDDERQVYRQARTTFATLSSKVRRVGRAT